MSFDIFLAPFKDGQPMVFNRSVILEAFGPDADLGEGEISRIYFSESDGAQVFGAEEEMIADGLSFNHFGGERFFEGLWKLAEKTNALVFWLGNSGNAVATSERALAHADPEFLEPLQPIQLVATGQELNAYLIGYTSELEE
jgi:hypothetical protein